MWVIERITLRRLRFSSYPSPSLSAVCDAPLALMGPPSVAANARGVDPPRCADAALLAYPIGDMLRGAGYIASSYPDGVAKSEAAVVAAPEAPPTVPMGVEGWGLGGSIGDMSPAGPPYVPTRCG